MTIHLYFCVYATLCVSDRNFLRRAVDKASLRFATVCVATQRQLQDEPVDNRTAGSDLRTLISEIRKDETKVHVDVGARIKVCLH